MPNSGYGRVYLVGGGPGDPGLISLKGLRCLQQADFILYDGLVNPLILRHTQAKAERAGRVDLAGRRTLQQADINARLIAEAKLGKTVVRLKGGDPYIFGRGSEEAAALAAEGIEFEVVPGITAATAAAEYAGFSLTHRDHASAVALITGHEDPLKSQSALDYNVLAKFPGTLVFYMGLHRLPEIADALITAGMPPETPAAIITKASTPAQKVVTDTIGALPAQVSEQQLRPPSLIIVGQCVALRDQIQWFERKPLFGLTIAITRPTHQADPQVEQLIELGAQPVLMPLVEIAPPEDWSTVDAYIDRIEQFSWLIFTSANGVQNFLDRLWQQGRDLRCLASSRIACIGSATARCLTQFHLKADLIPQSASSESLAEALIGDSSSEHFLWIRGNRSRDILSEQLTLAGRILDELIVYQQQDVEQLTEQVTRAVTQRQIDWITISSPAIARNLAQLLENLGLKQNDGYPKIAALSPLTAQAARDCGLNVAVIAANNDWTDLFAEIAKQHQPQQT